MELQRGVCSLCLENNKVFTPSDAEEFSRHLPRILYENFLTEAEFQKIKDSIKICTICCYKIEAANETRKAINKADKSEESSSRAESCHFCKDDKFIIKVKDDWKYFVSRTEGFLKLTDFPVCVCPRCLFYFDTIFNIKTKLSYKFPQLAVSTKSSKSPQKQNDTPKRKSASKSPPSTRKRKIFNNCFSYLQPLCNNNYHVDDELKTDSRLYKKIAYVNLTDAKNVNIKETPKVRPIIKIKLKQKGTKKGEKEKVSAKIVNDYLLDNSFTSQPYVKLCKSEEVPNTLDPQKNRKRHRSSSTEEKETPKEPEKELEEPAKDPSVTNPVPKRRISTFAESSEVENEEKSDSLINSDEINKIVEKYIKVSTFNDNNKLDLLEEIGESKIEKSTEANGIEKTDHKSNEEDAEVPPTEDRNNGTNPEPEEHPQNENVQNDEEKNQENEVRELSLSPNESLRKTTEKDDSSGEGSDSDTSDKLKSKGNTDRDSLNGSERKKKRVTFSDEIN